MLNRLATNRRLLSLACLVGCPTLVSTKHDSVRGSLLQTGRVELLAVTDKLEVCTSACQAFRKFQFVLKCQPLGRLNSLGKSGRDTIMPGFLRDLCMGAYVSCVMAVIIASPELHAYGRINLPSKPDRPDSWETRRQTCHYTLHQMIVPIVSPNHC